MQPSCPNISEQPAQYLAIFGPEKESDRIPFSLPGNRDIVVIGYRLHNVSQIDSRIRIENYGKVAHSNNWKNRT